MIDLVGEYDKICVGCKNPDDTGECEMWQLAECVEKWVKTAQPRIDKERIEYAIEVLESLKIGYRLPGLAPGSYKIFDLFDEKIETKISELRKQLEALK